MRKFVVNDITIHIDPTDNKISYLLAPRRRLNYILNPKLLISALQQCFPEQQDIRRIIRSAVSNLLQTFSKFDIFIYLAQKHTSANAEKILNTTNNIVYCALPIRYSDLNTQVKYYLQHDPIIDEEFNININGTVLIVHGSLFNRFEYNRSITDTHTTHAVSIYKEGNNLSKVSWIGYESQFLNTDNNLVVSDYCSILDLDDSSYKFVLSAIRKNKIIAHSDFSYSKAKMAQVMTILYIKSMQ